jgi:hypothetical protein
MLEFVIFLLFVLWLFLNLIGFNYKNALFLLIFIALGFNFLIEGSILLGIGLILTGLFNPFAN